HTGDIGFIDENGDLNYVTRKDWMVKINGQRVETLEVERILQSVEHIKEAVVKAFSDADSQNYLVGYYVSDAELPIDDIRISLAEKLPAYMIPRYLVRLDAIPKNLNGKTDRISLSPPDISLYKSVYAAPTTPEEQALCTAFEEVLECEKVGIHDDFFALGGDSIKVMKLLSTARLSWLSTDIIYHERTPEKIASYSCDEIDAAFPVQEDYPLTQDQLGMFTVSFGHAGETVYNMPGCRKLQSGVNLSKVQEALKQVINAHPYLKMYLRANENGDIRAVRNDAAEPVVSLLTCDHLPEMQTLIRPFTLLNAPLYRLELYDTADGKYLFFDFHHIIGDGTSLSLLMYDISSAYAGLPLLKETYTGFEVALIEENERKSSRFAQAKEYYDKLFEEAEISSLPVDYENPGTNKGTITTVYQSALRVGDVQAFCRQHDVTENVFFNTVFGYLLSIYSGQDKVYYSSVYHGRTRAGFEATVSLLATALPVCYQFEESKTVTAALKEIQEHLRCAMEYSSISQHDIIRFYGLSPDVGFAYQGNNAELFESVLSRVAESGNPGRVEHTLFADETNPGMPGIHVLTRNNLAVQVFLLPNGTYELFCEGNAALFGEEFLQDFLSCYEHLLAEFLEKETLADVSAVSDKAQALLDEMNHTDYEIDLIETVVDRFRACAAASPESEAVVFEEHRLTYREVDEISDRIAGHLVFHGVGKEKIVGLLLPISEYMPVCAMGVLKSGGAYLPLDAAYPLNALKFMIQNAGIQFLITTPDEYQKVKEVYSGDVLTTDEIASLPVCTIQLPHPNPEDLCMVIYTSGSTGLPKGVMLEHGNILSICSYCSDSANLKNHLCVGAYGNFGSIMHLIDYYPALISGGCIHVLPQELRLNLRKMQKYFNENQILFTHLTAHAGREFAQLEGTKTLRYLLLAGEKITPFTPSAPYQIHATYGFTENAGGVSTILLDKYYSSVPLGRIVYNTKLHITGKNGTKLLPPGAIGELWVSGFDVSRGYLNQPEKTAEVFRKNPFCSEKGYDRAYRAGDIASVSRNGILYFAGRRDEQVKIRGYRVELGEVEEVVRRFAGVKDAAVTAVAKESGEKFLAAYVVSDTQIDAKSLKQFVAAEKPQYMVPAVVMQIDAIPYNRNMKVDKRALPKAKFVVEDIIPPQNELQRKLFGIVANVLGHDKFGINTNFADAGLTSISSVQLMVLLSREFNVTVKLGAILEYNTVEKLAEYLVSPDVDEIYEILPDYPLTPIQYGTFVECVANPGTPIYNIPSLLHLGNATDIARVEAAVKAVVNAHPYLKMVLSVNSNGEIRAKRNDDAEVNFRI
ncbi:MAG: AMP-binding protein, partial [Methanocorpusculum sp.]|nr:AMP-binding protein [Candidatus Methanocorpusculum equi]